MVSANMKIFPSAYEWMFNALKEFSIEIRRSAVDFATIYSTAGIRFIFKNEQKIPT